MSSIPVALLLATLMLVDQAATPPQAKPPVAEVTPATAPDFDDAAAVAELRKAIAGREREPAESVFKNIQIHKGKPAAAILSIMDVGYRTSLGVHCTHCHDPRDWASDEKVAKRVARDMSRMVRVINEEHLAAIEGLQSERPVVNCTTCHRGQVKPALNLDGQ